MKYLPLVFFLGLRSIVLSQPVIPEFGKAELAELKLKSCPFDADANAMVLFDVYDVDVIYSAPTMRTSGNAGLTTERRVRIKIFNEKGFKHATIRIPYISRKRMSKFRGLNAYVYNLDANGNITSQKLDQDDFFKEKLKDNLGLLSFTFPNVKAGSVIEFRYKFVERNTLSLDPWEIQNEIPVAYSSMIIQSPVETTFKHYLLGLDTLNTVEELIKGDRFRRIKFSSKNVPAFQVEPLMSSVKDHLQRVVFIIIPSSGFIVATLLRPEAMWRMGGNMFKETYEKEYKKSITGTEKIIDTAQKLATNLDKLNYLYTAVRKWLPRKSEQTAKAEDIAEAWTTQVANSAEINLILMNLLKKTGVECYPLMVSTRENGRVNRSFPSASQFNGLDILIVDSINYYVVDASIPYQSCLNPPLNILNREGFLLSDSVQWITITNPGYLVKQLVTIFSAVNDSGVLEGAVDSRFFDYAKSFRLDSTLDAEEQSDDLDKNKLPSGLKITKIFQENEDKEGEPLYERSEFTYELNQSGNFYFIRPDFLQLEKKNLFTQLKRNTDIDLGCNQQFTLTFNINIPDSWEIESVPKNAIIRAPDSSFFYKQNITTSGKSIFYNHVFEINRPIFDKEEYVGVKEFFQLVYNRMGEEIILRKK